ncbi:gluconolactonase [Thermobacillus composti KWC4]|uniref:Gluconolactonase n=1 Tax=Thermobacillus composti (strain DSM 18247 / JCM 13945 / KWC4) TaxID=717605 RepID=L0EK18_THECK|nr:gluconolactonase [Thermobacillus composti KWC4]
MSAMLTYQAECVVAAGNRLGEGPVWDERLGELFWVDIEERKLQRFRPLDGRVAVHGFDQKIGCAVPAEDGSWILGLADGFYRFDPDTEQTGLIVHTDEPDADNRVNDGKCDPEGRFWAGTISAKWTRNASLYMLEAGGKLTRKLTDVICSNGLAWTADGRTMYYIDTGERIVWAFDFDPETGAIANRRVAIEYPADEPGDPDGMCIDAEGKLWIGHWGGRQAGRWDPVTGRKLASVPIPVENVTSCAFGGEHFDELYITTAGGGSGQNTGKQPLAGGLFRVKVDVPGLPVQRARV